MSNQFVYHTPHSSPRTIPNSPPPVRRIHRRLVLDGPLPSPLNLFGNDQESNNNEVPILVPRENWVYHSPVRGGNNNRCPDAPERKRSRGNHYSFNGISPQNLFY